MLYLLLFLISIKSLNGYIKMGLNFISKIHQMQTFETATVSDFPRPPPLDSKWIPVAYYCHDTYKKTILSVLNCNT